MTINNNQQRAFFNLLQAGLWEDVSMISNLSIPQNVDWAALYHLAEKQGVVGLIAAGLDRMTVNIPKTWALQFIGAALQIEQKNKAMNAFIADIISKMREADIKTLLVKGQGLAQCYEKPLCQLARIFPRKTFAYLPSIFLNVNWLKIKERFFAR